MDVVKECRNVKGAVHKGYVWYFQNPEWSLPKKSGAWMVWCDFQAAHNTMID